MSEREKWEEKLRDLYVDYGRLDFSTMCEFISNLLAEKDERIRELEGLKLNEIKLVDVFCPHIMKHCPEIEKVRIAYEKELAELKKKNEELEECINCPTPHILRTWDRERIEKFALHLLGDEWQQKLSEARKEARKETLDMVEKIIDQQIVEHDKLGEVYNDEQFSKRCIFYLNELKKQIIERVRGEK